MKLIFLFSLPRSGSTLLQRLIASHPQVATVSEPWLVLPYLYTLRGRGIYAEFDYKTSSTAIQDFCEELPNGPEEYLLALWKEFEDPKNVKARITISPGTEIHKRVTHVDVLWHRKWISLPR